MVGKLLMCVAMLGAGVAAAATEGVAEMAVQLFGQERAGKRVATGAVFIDGLYVKGPYAITREGNVILINGRVASRFKVESEAARMAAEKAATDAAAAKEDPAAAGGDEVVSDEGGASVGSDPTPTLGDVPRADAGSGGPRPSAIEERLAKRGQGGGIAGRLANQRRAQNLSEQSAKGSFNTEPTGDPEALFEEADYTYTPPSRPEPKAVPYVRPGAQKDMSQRLADAKKADAAQEAKRTAKAEPAPAGDDDEIATESFDDLTEAEIAAYTKRFAKRRADLEKILENDCLLLLSSQTSGAQYKNRSTMWRVVLPLYALCAPPPPPQPLPPWRPTPPAPFLQRIFDNRAANGEAMKTLILRVRREAKALQERSKNRI